MVTPQAGPAPARFGRAWRDSEGRPGIGSLVFGYWTSGQKAGGLAYLAVLLLLIFGSAGLHVWTNQLAGRLTDSLIGRQWAELKPLFILTVAVGIGTSSLTYLREALEGGLELRWRTWLTERYLDEWTGGHVYYDIEREGLLDNADQRIAEDVRLFVQRTLQLALRVVSVVVNTVTYTVLLWQLSGTLSFTVAGVAVSIPGYMVYLPFAFNAGSLLISHWVGKSMIGLGMRQQTVEADYRYLAMQLRENAEQIAFYRGGPRELHRLRDRFEQVRGNFFAIIVRTLKVGFTKNAYEQFFHPLPTLAALPQYFAGQLTLGGVTRVSGAFSALSGVLNFFSQAYIMFTQWQAVTNRLRDLSWAIHKAGTRVSGFVVERAEQGEITTGALEIRDPQGVALTRVPALRLRPGERWLIRGPSGTGKSTLLRAIAGLWPHGSGRIQFPATAKVMFLPQRSYIPAGTLKNALCYPADADAFGDAACRQALDACGLGLRAPSLTETNAWQQILSGGEQQRLAFARVLLQRPDFVFLDEATSALDPQAERELYEALIDALPASGVASVAHRESLVRFHDRFLDLARCADAAPPARADA